MTAPVTDPAGVVTAPDGPTTVPLVYTGIKVVQGEAAPDTAAAVETMTAAVNALLRRWLPVPADGLPWPAHHSLGATMLAVRLYGRRSSPAGVMDLGGDGPVYVRRNDPDIAMLLGLGDSAAPQVG